MPVTMLAPLPAQPQTFFFNLLQQHNPAELFDFRVLSKVTKEQLPFACLQMLLDTIRTLQGGENAGSGLSIIDTAQIYLLQKTLRQNNDALIRFNNKLAVTLSDLGQEVINQYLEGDAAELERRRYYNSRNNGYDIYTDMFAVALKLTPPTNTYLSRILEIKLHYFTGVAARLKIPTVKDPQALLNIAMAEQTKAYQLEENAAYIQNELGVLYLLKNKPETAQKYFLRATEIAPQWAIPWSNLGGTYAGLKNYDKALQASTTAATLQPAFPGGYINSGFVYAQTGKQLLAEELFRKSIHLNSRDYLPFERLGFLYTSTTQYAAADSFFYEADQRKKGFHFEGRPRHYMLPPTPFAAAEFALCPFDSNDVGKQDVMGHFVWGLNAFKAENFRTAEKQFKQVIELDKTNPLAFGWLGRILYRQQRWEEAAIIFQYAINYHLDKTAFNRYCDSVARTLRESGSKHCFVSTFRAANYDQIEDFYFAGRMFEQWNHYNEAESDYRVIIESDSSAIGGYYLLWNMFEKMGRYKDAEETILAYRTNKKLAGNRVLLDFYRRMIKRFPENGDGYYKAGQFCYKLAQTEPASFPFDKKIIDADTYYEHYLVQGFARPTVEDLILPGIEEKVPDPGTVDFPLTEGIAFLKVADSLLVADEEALADINYKLGDLYVWQGLAEKAPVYYEKSISLKPGNANTRLKLIDIYDSTYQFSLALNQLDSLYRRREINFDKQLLMAKYYIHNSRFDEAKKLLDTAKQLHPYKIPAIADLYGRMYMLSGNPKTALAFYNYYLMLKAGDAGTLYSIAKLYARMDDRQDAWKWLELSMIRGFRYHWVLDFDETWDSYRKQNKWMELQKRYPAKQYGSAQTAE